MAESLQVSKFAEVLKHARKLSVAINVITGALGWPTGRMNDVIGQLKHIHPNTHTHKLTCTCSSDVSEVDVVQSLNLIIVGRVLRRSWG